MRMDWRLAAGLLVIVGAIVGTVLGISFGKASDSSEATQYEVSVQFTTEVTQDDMDEVDAFLRAFDDDLDFLILEIFPPIGRAVVTSGEPDFCATVTRELEAKSYVDRVTCGPKTEVDQGDPDEPISSDNGVDSR